MKHKLVLFFVALFATTALWAQNNVITYTASAKLGEQISDHDYAYGLHTNAFNVSITSHTFSDSTGTITFYGDVTSIGYRAFYGCSGLTSITIPNSVRWIGNDAFYGCSGLMKTNYTGTVANWCKITFNGYSANPMRYSHNFYINDVEVNDLVIPNGVDTIRYSAFSGCSSLTSITIPTSVTSIGDYAFENCSGLTSVTIGNSVTGFGLQAFYGCSNIKSVQWNAKNCNRYHFGSQVESFTFGDSVQVVPYHLCSGMNKLTSITIPNSVTSIGDDAFYGCSGLMKTNYTGTVADWCKINFTNVTANPMYYSHNFYINDVEVKDLVIPNGVDTIRYSAFSGCCSLTSITIPNSVTSIGNYAFYGCTNLADIYCYAVTPPEIEFEASDYVFENVSKHCYIHIPAGTIRDYQLAAGWSDFYHFYEIGALPQGVDSVGVTVTNNYATFSWPVNPTANSYTLTITKNGEVFCSLIFNTMGQLVGMAFAPGRDTHHAPAATTTNYGYSFVVTGLDENSEYTFTFTAKDKEDRVIESTTGTFVTDESMAIENVSSSKEGRGEVIIENGQLYILRGGKKYTMQGAEVK